MAEEEAGERGGQTWVRGRVGDLVLWAATSTQVNIKQTNKQKLNKQTNKQQSNNQTKQTNKQNKHSILRINLDHNVFTGQVEAIVRSAAAATDGQEQVDGFVEDPVFEELLCADGSGDRNVTVGRGNPE